MANIALLEDVEQIRQASAAVSKLADEFDGFRVELKGKIEQELNTACKGDVADEYTNYYNEKIDPQLQEEKSRLDLVASTLSTTATTMENAENTVKSSF